MCVHCPRVHIEYVTLMEVSQLNDKNKRNYKTKGNCPQHLYV